TQDLFVPPQGSFVVADTSDAARNHALPGLVLVWAGSVTDVLKNTGDTLTITAGTATIDSVTYDATTPWTYATSAAVPAGCALSQRKDWTKWAAAAASWSAGLYGTPNAPNVDVTCP